MSGVGRLPIGVFPFETLPGVTFATFALNETTDYYAACFVAPTSDTITQLGCNISAVSGSPNLEISIQGVTSGGVPDGTIKSSGNAKAAWAAATGWTWQTLTSSYTATAGELLCVVVKLTSGTSATLNVRVTGVSGNPYGLTFDNATTTTTRLATQPVWGAKGSGTSFCWGTPVSTTTNTNITSASTVESGSRFLVPSWITSVAVCGMRVFGTFGATTTVEFGIYSGGAVGDTTRGQVVTLGTNDLRSTAIDPITVYFPSVTINGGSAFRLSTRVTGGTYTERSWGFASSVDLQAFGGFFGDQGVQRSRRTTGNWTDSTTDLVFIDPILSNITVSGSGGVALPLVRAI